MTGISAVLRRAEADPRAGARGAGERPVEAGMQPAGIRHGEIDRYSSISNAIVQAALRQPVFDREREGEGIERARRRIVARDKPDEIATPALDLEDHAARKTVQAEIVAPARHPRAVARPADDREQDRTDLRPDRGIARPQQIDAADAPGPRLGADRATRSRASPAAKTTSLTNLRPRAPPGRRAGCARRACRRARRRLCASRRSSRNPRHSRPPRRRADCRPDNPRR